MRTPMRSMFAAISATFPRAVASTCTPSSVAASSLLDLSSVKSTRTLFSCRRALATSTPQKADAAPTSLPPLLCPRSQVTTKARGRRVASPTTSTITRNVADAGRLATTTRNWTPPPTATLSSTPPLSALTGLDQTHAAPSLALRPGLSRSATGEHGPSSVSTADLVGAAKGTVSPLATRRKAAATPVRPFLSFFFGSVLALGPGPPRCPEAPVTRMSKGVAFVTTRRGASTSHPSAFPGHAATRQQNGTPSSARGLGPAGRRERQKPSLSLTQRALLRNPGTRIRNTCLGDTTA